MSSAETTSASSATISVNLRELKYYCIFVSEARRAHVQAQFDAVAMGESLCFVRGPTRYGGVANKLLGASVGTMRAVDTALRAGGSSFRPFVVIEDNTSWTPALDKPCITVPTEADALYIGTSVCAVQPTVNCFGATLVWEDIGLDVVRIYNMLSTHALVVLTPAYAAAYSRALMEAACMTRFGQDTVLDCVTTRLGAYYVVCAVRTPYLFQDARVGGYEKETRIPIFLSPSPSPFPFPFPSSAVTTLSAALSEYAPHAPIAALRDGALSD